jgi:hypothetical protein
MSDSEQIDLHAERIRSSDVLGRSDQLRRLFDYLVDCSRTGKVPKESVIAVEVFGRGTDFDVSQDAAVRVYIHKLRRKFEEFYTEQGNSGGARLTIPKGEYRLVVELPADVVEPVVAAPVEQPTAPRNPWKQATFGAAAALVLLAAAGLFFLQRAGNREFKGVRDSPIWARLLNDSRPITVVLGDYYIFAEADELAQPKRLVRDFSINSRSDLDQYLMEHPELTDRYMDAQLAYLPTSSASVMADIMPLLASTHRPVRVTMMSDLSPDALKSTDVVYVGYLSGLGMLFDATFSGSRFSIGGSYDELVDARTRTQYISQAGDRYARPSDDSAPGSSSAYREYSLITGFEGPSGNQVLVIAGMRDIGLMQAGEALTGANSLRQLSERLKTGAPFEALYEVTGINSTNMASKLLVTSPRTATDTWSRSAHSADRLGTVAAAGSKDR